MAAKLIRAVLLVVILGSGFPAFVLAQAMDVAVVVNPGNPVSHLSMTDLRKIFAGEKRTWPGGAPIKLIARPHGSHERVVLLSLLNMSESEYKQYWTAQVMRSEAASEPIVVPSFGMQREAVRAFPGGITLIDMNLVRPEMKVVKIEGHLPGDPAYPLR